MIHPELLSIEYYHNSVPVYLSKTSIKDFLEHGPKWWRLAYIDKSLKKTRPDGALQGLALDCYLTEGPAQFAQKFAVKPDGMSFATKEGKAWRDAHDCADIISSDDNDILADAVEAVRNSCVWEDVSKALSQHSIRRHSDSLGLGLQSRPDWIHPSGNVLWDLKKTRDLDRFGAQAFDLGYFLQAAIAGWCLSGEGKQLEHAYLVAVEWERGARCRVYEIPHEMLEHGDMIMRKGALEISRRIKENDWSDDEKNILTLDVPAWVKRKVEQ